MRVETTKVAEIIEKWEYKTVLEKYLYLRQEKMVEQEV